MVTWSTTRSRPPEAKQVREMIAHDSYTFKDKGMLTLNISDNLHAWGKLRNLWPARTEFADHRQSHGLFYNKE